MENVTHHAGLLQVQVLAELGEFVAEANRALGDGCLQVSKCTPAVQLLPLEVTSDIRTLPVGVVWHLEMLLLSLRVFCNMSVRSQSQLQAGCCC
jgi:hypothetical protein